MVQAVQEGRRDCLGALPIFHVFGMTGAMNISVHMGWTDVLVPRPQPPQLLEAIRKFRPTFAALVPTMYIGMINHPDLKKTDMSCIKGAFSGSAPLPVEVIHEFERLTGAVIVEGFGMTETTPVTHVNPFAGGARKVEALAFPSATQRLGSWISRRASSTCPWESPASSSSRVPRS